MTHEADHLEETWARQKLLPLLPHHRPSVEARWLGERCAVIQQEDDGVLQLLGLLGQRHVSTGLPSQFPSLPLPTPLPEPWALAQAQVPLHTRAGWRHSSSFPRVTEALATHLWQLQPDGLGAVGQTIVEFQARGPVLLQGAQQAEPLQVLQGYGAAQFLGIAEMAELGSSGVGLQSIVGEDGPWVLGQHQGRSFAHLGAGVHEDEVPAVEPQEGRSWEDQLAHSKHHVHSVAKEGQLTRGLCGRRGPGQEFQPQGLEACPALLPGAGEGRQTPLTPRPPCTRPTNEADPCFLGTVSL